MKSKSEFCSPYIRVGDNGRLIKKQAFQFELSHLFIIGQLRAYLTKKAAP